jgi:hypothetical protein
MESINQRDKEIGNFPDNEDEKEFENELDKIKNDDFLKDFEAQAYFCKKMEISQLHLSLYIDGIEKPKEEVIKAIEEYFSKSKEEKNNFFIDFKKEEPKIIELKKSENPLIQIKDSQYVITEDTIEKIKKKGSISYGIFKDKIYISVENEDYKKEIEEAFQDNLNFIDIKVKKKTKKKLISHKITEFGTIG